MPFPLESIFDIGTKLIDRLIPDKEKQAEAKLKLFELQQSGDLAVIAGQNEINKAEAANANLFVSGWRPSVGWCCSAGLAIQFIVRPVLEWVGMLAGHPIPFPTLDTGTLTTLLFAMLGVGGMRTIEKLNGVSR